MEVELLIEIPGSDSVFEEIISKLKSGLDRPWILENAIFVPGRKSYTLTGADQKLEETQVIVVHGAVTTGGNLDSHSHWRYLIKTDFEKATKIKTLVT